MTSLPTTTTRDGANAGKSAVHAVRSGWAMAAAGFSAVMAVLLLGTWFVLLATGQVPELSARPFSTWSLLAAEFVTAGLLLAGATGVVCRRGWARRVLLVALGMLLYTTVNTIGVSAEQGIWAAAIWMALVAAGAAALIARSLRERSI